MWEVWEVWEDGEEVLPPTLPTLPTLSMREKSGLGWATPTLRLIEDRQKSYKKCVRIKSVF